MAHIRSMLYAVGGGGIGNIVENGIVKNPESGITFDITTERNTSASTYRCVSNTLAFNGNNIVKGKFTTSEGSAVYCNGINSWYSANYSIANSELHYNIPSSLVDKYKYFDIHPIISGGNQNYTAGGIIFEITITAHYGAMSQNIKAVSHQTPTTLTINQLFSKIPTSIERNNKTYQLTKIQIYIGNSSRGVSERNRRAIVDTFKLHTLKFHN